MTNPGDDLVYDGGEVWPDFDIVVYGLAGVFDDEQGWGLTGDTYTPRGWFRIGDRDLTYARERAALLERGASRTEAARHLCRALGVRTEVVPASAEPFRTFVETDAGLRRPFQEWLVRMRASEPPVEIHFEPPLAHAAASAVAAVEAADVVVLGPSSPVASLGPILALPELGTAVRRAPRVIAVSPTVLRRPPRTPPEQSRYRVRELLLGLISVPHTPSGVAALLSPLTDVFVLDLADAEELSAIDTEGLAAPILDDPVAAARALVDRAASLSPRELPRRVPAVHRDDRAGDEAGGIR